MVDDNIYYFFYNYKKYYPIFKKLKEDVMVVKSITSNDISLKLQPISNSDMPFLYKIYRSTRIEEMKLTDWNSREIEEFLEMQFILQHKQYMENYKQASFDIIIYNNLPIGRLYINRYDNEIRIIDIGLLPEYRRIGIGNGIISDIITESECKNLPISLHVEYNNPATSFYRHLGFEPEKDLGVYIFMKRFPKGI